MSPQHDREATLSSFLRSPLYPGLTFVPLYHSVNPTHSNVLSINSPSLSYTLLSALLTYLYYPVNAKPKLILYNP